ncbi:immunity protein YezG family protein [Solibacillus ferritrahens]|uniref:immunity protein YezG family protein n=1 Tax=Solibacillus ferritrahens TaxID=3098620 RepID=UPI00300931D7
MDENKLGSIYNNIVQTVIKTIPEEWEEVYVNGEITEDVRTAFFYYYPEKGRMPVHSHNISNIFEIEKEDCKI